ncbi:glycoside hydrolase family 127 protein [Bacteroides oleiciplenus]|uniref:glycoside hydrolase family 127 protein n=1 Tax=Bacteroides oleiciplenus TaxID=626931 RepID=UPI0026DBF0D7|nr:beta-L-arabinofuranosidase domain-containing protein [Bacteroides oleiciplenus]
MRKRIVYLLLSIGLFSSCAQQDISFTRKMEPVNFSQVTITDQFWKPRLETHAATTLGVCIEQCELATNRVRNFAIAAKVIPGEFEGLVYDDSDLYKMIEGVSYSLTNHSNPALEAKIDTIVDYISKAQMEDGYLMTYYILGDMNQRWTDMDKHEMYCCGHLIEAAIAYDDATGKRKLLDVAIRFANHLIDTFGPNKRVWVPGHQEIELALVKLYYKTHDSRYLDFSKWLLAQRGHGAGTWDSPDYHQDLLPVKEQRTISGHAVRAMYMFTAMADVAAATNDREYMVALDSLWHDVVDRNMYLTGGIGSSRENEGFTEDYDLPNDKAYCETCASVGMVLWNNRMNLLSGDAKYADVLERSMYNGALAGISLSGDKFFYVNPLETDGTHHRKVWYRTACCPSQISRFLPSIGNYLYAKSDKNIWVNLYIGSTARISYQQDTIEIRQITDYPWDGNVRFEIKTGKPFLLGIKFRIPEWCKQYSLSCNGQPQLVKKELGYVTLERDWKDGDVVELNLDMEVEVVEADPRVKENVGKRAIQRGPLVYCLEQVDNPVIEKAFITSEMSFSTARDTDLGVVEIVGTAADETLNFIPYYAWDNREPGKMKVWVNYKK